jgi:hypothetical protein
MSKKIISKISAKLGKREEMAGKQEFGMQEMQSAGIYSPACG